MLTALAITGPNVASGLLWGFALISIICGVITTGLFVGTWLADRATVRPESDPDKIATARHMAAVQAFELAHDPEEQVRLSRESRRHAEAERAWEDHPARRADHAKVRTAMSQRRMVEADWKRATGGGDAA